MGKGKDLSAYEKGKIDALHEQGLNNTDIAKIVLRSRSSISRYLNQRSSITGKKASGRKESFTSRTRRSIFNLATSGSMSSNAIVRHLGLKESKWTVQRCLNRNGNARYSKMKQRPLLKSVHINKRLDFARKYMDFGKKWQTVLFSDEKKFNLDGPDGFKYYWHDLRKEPKYYSKRVSGGSSVMVWAGIGFGGKTDIVFANGRINSEIYQNMIGPQLEKFAEAMCGPQWIFQQDNAPIHCSMSSKNWFLSKDIHVMVWPPLSPDLNPIENIWGILARDIYSGGCQYENIKALRDAILRSWEKISVHVLRNFIDSMPSRVFDLISSKGQKIDY